MSKSLKTGKTVAEKRQHHFQVLLEEILDDHQLKGFHYPRKTIGSVQLQPIILIFQEASDSLFGSFGESIRYKNGAIVIDLYKLYDLQTGIDEAMSINEKLDKNEFIRNSYEATRHLFNSPGPTIIKCQLSEALGTFFLENLLKTNSACWLNENNLAANIIKGGIRRYFFHLYQPPGETLSSDVWDRFGEDQDALATFWSGRDMREKGGYDLLQHILRDFRQDGINWLVNNPPSVANGCGISHLPNYAKYAFEELSNQAY